MRIALFDNLPTGGAKRAMHDFAGLLRGRGHDMNHYTLSTAALDFLPLDGFVENKKVYEFEPGRHRVFYLENAMIRMRDLDRLDALCRRIARDMNAGDYDVAFLHHCRIARAPLVMQYLKMPCVYYCQEPSRRFYEPSLPEERMHGNPLKNAVKSAAWDLYYAKQKNIEERVTRQADMVLVNSNYSKAAVERAYGIKCRVNYLSVDSEKFRPLGRRRENLLLTVGRLNPKKGHTFLIDALSRVRNIGEYKFAIVADSGSEVDAARLRKLAREKAVPLDVWIGVPEERLVELYNIAAAVVYAPVGEPFGLVPLEAGACGTAVAAVREGGVAETVLDGETGLLTGRDPREFAVAVEKLLSSPELRARLGDKARENTLKNWNGDRSVDALLENFESAIHAHKHKA